MSPSPDIALCADDGCTERSDCQRYVLPHVRAGRAPIIPPSLFPFDIPLGRPCPWRVPYPKGASA